jgi:hypothetical protein
MKEKARIRKAASKKNITPQHCKNGLQLPATSLKACL